MKLKSLANKIKGFWFRNHYVVLDGRANSITISQAIYNHIMSRELTSTEVFVFRISSRGTYGFCMREDWEELRKSQTHFSTLQYNQEHHKIGFRSDLPSVTAILDDYNLPLNRMVRLTCIPRVNNTGEPYYEIQRPD